MTTLTDIANDMDTYPTDEVLVSIVDVAVHIGVGPNINIGETFKFKAQVENTGHVNMTGVSLHVFGLSGAEISLSPTTGFTAGTLTVGSLNVNGGGGSQKTGYLYLKPPSATKPAGTPLVEAHFAGWTGGNFDHYFTNHTLDDFHSPKGTYSAQVFPA
jgi:hypothetical protein